MKPEPIKFSFSSIKTWKNCPRQFEETYLQRRFKKEPTPEMQHGLDQHKVLQKALENKEPEPPVRNVPLKFWWFLVQKKAQAEQKLAITRLGIPNDFFGKETWLRGVLDVLLVLQDYPVPIDKRNAIVVDWKTGSSRYPDELQGKVSAALLKDKVDHVYFILSFIKDGTHFPYYFHTRTAWQELLTLTKTIEEAQEYPPRPSGLCRFCPVTSCEYNK